MSEGNKVAAAILAVAVAKQALEVSPRHLGSGVNISEHFLEYYRMMLSEIEKI